jgi:hypothetical protein
MIWEIRYLAYTDYLDSLKSQDEENRSTSSKYKDKARTRSLLLIATAAIVTVVFIRSKLQIATAVGWGFDESELNSVDISAEDESGSDESLISEGESQTVDEPFDVR